MIVDYLSWVQAQMITQRSNPKHGFKKMMRIFQKIKHFWLIAHEKILFNRWISSSKKTIEKGWVQEIMDENHDYH